MLRILFVAMLAGQLLAACRQQPAPALTAPDNLAPLPEAMLAAVDSAAVRADLATLSADSMEGRGPGTRGEARAVAYIAAQMEEMGLTPAGDQGRFFQEVPLLGSTPHPRGPLTFTAASGQTLRLDFIDEFIADTDLDTTGVSTVGDLVFAGFGIDAPDYGWNDYKGADVAGKILLLFVNDPVAPAEEPDLFQGDTLTYYGRWTYKYEEARRRGAKGVLLVHTVPTAGYPFSVLSNSAAGEQIQLAAPPENPMELKGWITEDAAGRLARLAGTTLDAWYGAANKRDFQPQPLPIEVTIDIDYTTRRFTGTNVVGKLSGRVRPAQAILYSAHHDHLGIGVPDARGDSIYNGAVDNASGVAMLLSAAAAFTAAPEPPERTVIFASVTAEESGLLGSTYYARRPHIPLAQTIANINVDAGNVDGATTDIVGLGAERSELGRLFREAAAEEGLTVSPDANPNQGSFFRSDQLSFARAGVPGVFIGEGRHYVGRPDAYAQQVFDDYVQHRYHQPGDAFDPAWPMAGLLQQIRVAVRLGYRLANSDLAPAWNPGEAFAQARQSLPD